MSEVPLHRTTAMPKGQSLNWTHARPLVLDVLREPNIGKHFAPPVVGIRGMTGFGRTGAVMPESQEVFKAHRLWYHSTLGLRVIKEKTKNAEVM